MPDYQRLLVITEEPLRSNSLGFGRTMTNIFENYPKDKLLFYIPAGDYSHEDYKTLGSKFVTFSFKPLKYKRPDRFGSSINRVLDYFNPFFQSIFRKREVVTAIEKFAPNAVLIAPMMYPTLQEGRYISRLLKKPTFIYLMDDWFKFNPRHFVGSLYNTARQVLREADGWIMISEYLSQSLSRRFKIEPKKLLVLHNPIDESQMMGEIDPASGTYSVAYAGSIWKFHFDALEKAAQAIFKLRQAGHDIELVVYCQEVFAEMYSDIFNAQEVKYGGLLDYEMLFATLNRHHLLLCTTSFDKQYDYFVGTSVFTKITDYMASGRPVWCYGPEYAANNKYAEAKGIGFNTHSENTQEVETFLLERMENRLADMSIVKDQNKVLKENYTIRVVLKKLTDFING